MPGDAAPGNPPTVWAGIDVGKTHHWVEIVDDCGATFLSRWVLNDQTEVEAVIAEIVALVENVGGPSTSSGPRRRCCWRC